MSQEPQQISIKLIPTDKLKATVYDLSKERDQINKVISDIETEIYSRGKQEAANNIKKAVDKSKDQPKTEPGKPIAEKPKDKSNKK